jgi:hypothetical protein
MTRIKEGKTNKSLGPGYYSEVKSEKRNKGFGRASTRDDAHKKAVQNVKKKDKTYRF